MSPFVRYPLLVAAALVAIPGSATAQDRCEEERSISESLPTAGVDLLNVTARAGRLEITGRPGQQEIQIDATLCAEHPDDLARLEVRSERSGSRADVETIMPEWDALRRSGNVKIDLVISAPAGMAVRVEDGSGHTFVEGVGGLEITDGSGELQISDIAGDVMVDDGSGDMVVLDIEGSVQIEDGSGEVVVSGVGGDVVLEDGSGQVEISQVARNVHVRDKGSGQILAEDVDGDLRVEGTRRERVRYNNIGGTLDLPPARRRGRGS